MRSCLPCPKDMSSVRARSSHPERGGHSHFLKKTAAFSRSYQQGFCLDGELAEVQEALELPYDAGFHSAANGKVTTLNQVRYY